MILQHSNLLNIFSLCTLMTKWTVKISEIDFNNHIVDGSVYIVILSLLCVNYVRKKMNSYTGVIDKYNAWHKRKEIELYNQRY